MDELGGPMAAELGAGLRGQRPVAGHRGAGKQRDKDERHREIRVGGRSAGA